MCSQPFRGWFNMVRTMPQVWTRDSEVTFKGSPAYPGWPGNCLVEELRNCRGGQAGDYQEHKTGSVLGRRTACGKMQGWETSRLCLGELVQQNHRTWAEKGHEFIKGIMFKFTQAVLGVQIWQTQPSRVRRGSLFPWFELVAAQGGATLLHPSKC